jgi:hypothetical protein
VRRARRGLALLGRLLRAAAAASLRLLRRGGTGRWLLRGESDGQDRNRGQERQVSARHHILQTASKVR